MPRRIVIRTAQGDQPVLIEVPTEDEAQLQELVRDNPDLLPVDDFSLTGPLLVIGRETSVQSGAIDLACLARSGDVLIIEFKTGPQNADFRHAVAQLLDYGAQIWRQTFPEFEQAVAVRFFSDERNCLDARLRHKRSLEEAAKSIWPDMPDEEWQAARQKIEAQLASGGFHYVLAAQRFTPSVQSVIDYMNAVAPVCRFYAVEVVRFASDDLSAFEARSVRGPSSTGRPSATAGLTNEADFLSKIDDQDYREGLQEFFEACRGLRYRFEWGTLGASIRLVTPFRGEPITVAWVFPPGRSGWMGLRDIALGFDQYSADTAPGSIWHLTWFLESVEALAGAERTHRGTVRTCQFQPVAFLSAADDIVRLLGELSARVQET